MDNKNAHNKALAVRSSKNHNSAPLSTKRATRRSVALLNAITCCTRWKNLSKLASNSFARLLRRQSESFGCDDGNFSFPKECASALSFSFPKECRRLTPTGLRSSKNHTNLSLPLAPLGDELRYRQSEATEWQSKVLLSASFAINSKTSQWH